MGTFFFIDYLVSFFILIAMDTPWWAWLIYIVSVLAWLVIGGSHDGEAKGNTINNQNREQE